MLHYIDSSALAKLVMVEDESAALRTWLLAADRGPVTSDLARTELMRLARRKGSAATVAARALLDRLTLLSLSAASYESAGRLNPIELRSLDALHLAAALSLGDRLEGFVTYDIRQAEAAGANGVPVVAPA